MESTRRGDEKVAGNRTVSVVLPVEDRSWLIRRAAERATSTGGRVSVSEVVRDIIEGARNEAGDRR